MITGATGKWADCGCGSASVKPGGFEDQTGLGPTEPPQQHNNTGKTTKSIGKLVRGIQAVISNKSNSIYRTNLLVHDTKDRYSWGRDSRIDPKDIRPN